MTTIERTMLTFGIFVVNLYLVLTVHQGMKDEAQMQVIFTLTTLVFLTGIGLSIYQRDASYFFGLLALYYCPFIILRTGLSLETGATLIATGGMLHGLAGFPRPRWPDWASLEFMGGLFGRRRLLNRLLAAARARTGGEHLLDSDLQEYAALEHHIARVVRCLDGADPALDEALKDSVKQMSALQSDFARLLLRGAHLGRVLEETDRRGLEAEIEAAEREAAATHDPVVKAQLADMIALKRKRLEEMDRLATCAKRIQVQRAQILELVKGAYETVNALKFADITTMKASSSQLSRGIVRIRGELESLEQGLLTAETLAHHS
ncbi:MAG: hypothetical protein OZSIB_1441 [Candidatus Ozemobacter sibiricus]|uniref:Uncharacterized protein n=1 Tax=Candidatus Ozemobacter sibiricus TaxID=2268124 RepID=A0A367ZME2_9BACT|nr:MAG: hypothetical protein OZSIB_1441 [Candidatus Ozemobacter sibiricus]